MEKEFEVICIGNAAMDAFVEMPPTQLEKNCLVIEAGTKIETKNLSLYSGGGATNVCVGLARRGIKTAILASVGKDSFGKQIKEELIAEKIDTRWLFETENYPTAFSVILTGFGDRIILVYRGATRHLTEEKAIDFSALEKTKWVYLSSLHAPQGTTKKIIEEAKKNGTKIAFNPGKTEIQQKLKGINGISFLSVNEEEAAIITGKKNNRQNLKILSKIAAIVAITKGKNGAEAFDGKKYFSIKTKKVKVKDTTGAGDAFNSAFLSEIIKENGIKKALKEGIKNSCSVIQFLGAKNKLLEK